MSRCRKIWNGGSGGRLETNWMSRPAVEAQEKEEDEASLQQRIKYYKKRTRASTRGRERAGHAYLQNGATVPPRSQWNGKTAKRHWGSRCTAFSIGRNCGGWCQMKRTQFLFFSFFSPSSPPSSPSPSSPSCTASFPSFFPILLSHPSSLLLPLLLARLLLPFLYLYYRLYISNIFENSRGTWHSCPESRRLLKKRQLVLLTAGTQRDIWSHLWHLWWFTRAFSESKQSKTTRFNEFSSHRRRSGD